MAIVTEIVSGKGESNKLDVRPEGTIGVVVHPHPPINENISVLPFRDYFEFESSNDMTVNGSSISVDFCISANQDYDIFIKSLAVQISDGDAQLNLFGGLTALTNGVEWIYFRQSEGDYQLHDGIKDNLEFIKLGLGTPAFGDGDSAYKIDIKGKGTEDTYMPIIDISETFGMPWGLRLEKGSTDRLIFKVKDNLSGLEVFNIIGYGTRL